MSFYMVIVVSLLFAFLLQIVFSMIQMKGFDQYYRSLRETGRVAIGKAKGGFHAGAVVMFAVDKDGIILKGCFMRGFTIAARFRNYDHFNGTAIGDIKKSDCNKIGIPLTRAVLDASSNYNIIMGGGEIAETPGLLTRAANILFGKTKRA